MSATVKLSSRLPGDPEINGLDALRDELLLDPTQIVCAIIARAEILMDVVEERDRQNARWGEQNHPDGTGPDKAITTPDAFYGAQMAEQAREICEAKFNYGAGTWQHILQEEVCEAYAATGDALRNELIQVAAVAVAWVEAIDRRNAAPESVPAGEG